MANVDYDPKKAHEYYMRTRKLKGRHSTKGFSGTQKEQWGYAKAQLQEQKKTRDNAASESISAARAKSLEQIKKQKQAQKERLVKEATLKIDLLRQRLHDMPPEKRRAMKKSIQGVIDDIKASKAAKATSLSESARSASKSVRDKASADRKSAKEKSKAQYEKDLDAAYKKIKR